MAASLTMIIGTGRAGRLGRCTAHLCDRVFYDTTRNGSRRFCGPACQNRAKSSAYRTRRPHGG
jgi:predicted RNA-binding Zn ribbon-like protein